MMPNPMMAVLVAMVPAPSVAVALSATLPQGQLPAVVYFQAIEPISMCKQ
jgi:hypothetical protein